MKSSFVLGTRGSDLALAQARIVTEQLQKTHAGLTVDIRVIRTTGDERLDISLSAPGALDKGLFTKELEVALRQGKIDFAVHSLKDLPVDPPDGLILGAILERADPSEVLVTKAPGGLAALAAGACVATSSPRRRAQLLRLRPDLTVPEIRGNVPTRLRKLVESTALDGLLLAKAGLDRLGPRVVPEGLHLTVMTDILPAPGQGAIAVECREDDIPTRERLAAIHHESTARCVTAERALLKSLGGGCALPLGALATLVDGQIELRTFLPED